ncbi:YSIRK-type signal peptide-containing protein [Streptococcus sp. SPS1]|uniref:YSIRK-type signal peptide-containing protein n=1 Tax=Streptococcus sp. SPS1 TaxID=3018247 RepID=UPI00263DA1F7|nr:YSIRK-type signal peptide-containing protein [Streptococcus sp. SPS1]MDN5026426.1 YSIRK-type signal peptide-containing protein [Streptococcus sp. SPS1]
MNFKSRKCEENGEKVLRYSIRKHHLGVASVAVASLLFFATGVTTVQADGPAAGSASTPGSPAEEQPTEHGKPLDEEIEEKERKEEEERRQHKGEFFEKDNPSLEKNTNTEDADANRVYKEPKEGTSAKGLYKVLDSLPDDFQNNELNYLKNMDAIGDKIGLKSGEIRELGLTLEKINKLGLTPEKLEQLGVEPSLIKKLNLTPERIKEIAIRPELIKEYILNEKENIALSLIFEKVEKESFTSEKLKELGLKDELSNRLNLTPEKIKELLANPELIKELKLTPEENKELNAVFEKFDKETLNPEILKKMGMKEELIQKLNLTPEKIKELVLNPQLVKQLILEEEENKKINNKLIEAFEKLEKENLTVNKLKSLGLTQELADKLKLNPDKIKEYLLNPVLMEKENLTKDELEVVHNAFDRLEKESLLPEVLKKYNEFGGWKPIGGGTFAIGKKNESGYFTGWRVTGYTPEGKPIIEQGGMLGSDALDRIYLHEQALDYRFKYMLMLAKGRTIANRTDKAQDGSEFKIKTENNNVNKEKLANLPVKDRDDLIAHSPNIEGFNGIEKRFEAFSSKYGSTLKLDFVTGYISDFEFKTKGSYRIVVKAIKKDKTDPTKEVEETIYDHTINHVDGVVENEERYSQGVDLRAINKIIKNLLKDEYNKKVNALADDKYKVRYPGERKDKNKLDALREEAKQELAKKGDVTFELPIDKDELHEVEKNGKPTNKFKEGSVFTVSYATVANKLNNELRTIKDAEVQKNSPVWAVSAETYPDNPTLTKYKDPDRVYKLLNFVLPTAKKIIYHGDTDQLELQTDPEKVRSHREELKSRLEAKEASLASSTNEEEKTKLKKEISALKSAIGSTNSYTYVEARNGSKEAKILGSHMEATEQPSTSELTESEYNRIKTNELAAKEEKGLSKFTHYFVEKEKVRRSDVLPDDKLSERITKEIGGDEDKLGKGGYFSTGDIHLEKDIVAYKIQIFSGNNKRVGINPQSPRIQYNLPVLANFSIVQDTLKAAQALSHRILDQTIKEEKEKVDEKRAEKQKLVTELEKNIPPLEDKLKPLESKQKELEDKQNELGDKIKPFEDKQKEVAEKLKPIEDKQKELEEKQKSVADKLKDKDKLSQDELKKLEDEAKKLEDEAKKLEDEAKPFKDEAKKLEDDAKKIKEEVQSLKNELESTKSKIQLEKEKIQDIDESFKEVEKGLNKIHNQIDATTRTHQLKLLFKGNITVKYKDNNGKALKESATLAKSGNFIRVNEEGNLSETDKNDQLVKTHKVFENGNVLEIVENKIVKAYKVDHNGKTIKTYVVDENGDIFASDEKGEKIQELKLYKLVKEDRVEKVLNPETNKEEEKTIHEEYLARLDKDGKVAGKYNKKHLIKGKDKPEDLLEISNKIGLYYDSTSEYLRTIKKDGVTYRLSTTHRGGVTETSNRPSGVLSSVNTTVTYLYDEVARAKVQVLERDDNNNLIPVENQNDFILESLVGKDFPAEAVNEKIAELKKIGYDIVSSDFGNGKTRVADNVSDVEDNISQIYTIIVKKPIIYANVVANYYKDGTEEKLAESDTQENKRVFTDYETKAKKISSKKVIEETELTITTRTYTYTLKANPENSKGKVVKGGVVVNYFYTENVEESVVLKITIWRDTEGNELKPYEVGKKAALEFNGYRFVKTATIDGITIHLYEKIQKPFIPGKIPTPPTPVIPNPQPNPVEPQPNPVEPQPNPVEPQPEPEKPNKTEEPCKPELPNTGTETNAGLTVLGVLAALSGIGLVTRKKEEYEN